MEGLEGSQQWDVKFSGDDGQGDQLELGAWKRRRLRKAEISHKSLLKSSLLSASHLFSHPWRQIDVRHVVDTPKCLFK